MNDWESILGDYQNSGIYNIEGSVIDSMVKPAAEGSMLDYVRLDLSRVSRKVVLLERLARIFQFPSYSGVNWDALYDNLTNILSKPANGYVIHVVHNRTFSRKSPADWNTLCNVFEATAGFWMRQKKSFFVIFN